MPKDKRQIAAEKRKLIRDMLGNDKDLSNHDINEKLISIYGSMIESRAIADARKDLGIVTWQSKRKRRKTITHDDVIVLQKGGFEIPSDVIEVAAEVLDYMRGMKIKSFEINDDGSLKIKMIQELETVVTK